MTGRGLALAWALFLAACALWVGIRLPQARIESSIFALLPEGKEGAAARAAGAALRAGLEKRFLVLLAHADPARAQAAAEAYAARLRQSPAVHSATAAVPPAALDSLSAFYAPHRFALLSPADREALRRDPDFLYRAAREVLYLPPGLSGSLGFGQDPFGTFGRWLSSRQGAGSGLALRGGYLTADLEGRAAVAVLGALGPRGRGSEAIENLAEDFRAAGAEAQGLGAAVLRSGFVFHELQAARRAHAEMAVIGTVSGLSLLVLLLAGFRGLRPALLGFLPVAMGCLAGTAALLLAGGGQVHLLVMVFGATIVGVAEDYGMLFIAGLYEPGPWDAARRLRAVRRSLILGLTTTALGYAALFFVPIPGVRQIGIFSIAGLAAAWATVMLWYPWLARGLRPMGDGPRAFAAGLEKSWPRLGRGRFAGWALGALALAAALGCWRLGVDDDVRLLYSRDSELQAEEARVGAALGLPASSRFFLIRGKSEQEVLESEEKLLEALASIDSSGAALGAALFAPSLARQKEDAALLATALEKAAPRLARDLETPELAGELRRRIADGSAPVALSHWLETPVSAPFRHLWPGDGAKPAGVVLPGNIRLDADGLQALAQAAGPGVELRDPVREVSETLGLLRRHLAWVMAVGFAVLTPVLVAVFRGRAWRAAAPAVLGVAAGLGGLGWSGQPLNLFSLLALALVIGMGLDYGIFIQESSKRRPSALVAINLGAASTLLAFGMLVFSSTPALRGFGQVLAVGLGAAWLTAPCFAKSEEEHAVPAT